MGGEFSLSDIITNDKPSKQDNAPEISVTPKISEFERSGAKPEGGMREAAENSGMYKKNGKKYLVKKDVAPGFDVGEFLAGAIFTAFVPNNSAKVDLVQCSDGTYLTSEFLGQGIGEKYQDGFKHLALASGKKEPKVRSKIVGEQFKKDFKEVNYKGAPETFVTSLLVADFDVHMGNIGVVTKGREEKLCRLDYGWAFKRDFQKDFDPHSMLNHLPGTGPTNHFKTDFPEEMKINPEFVAELDRVSKLDVEKTVSNAFDRIFSNYTVDEIKAFGEGAGVVFPSDRAINLQVEKKFEGQEVNLETKNLYKKALIAEETRGHVVDALKGRQQSLKNFSTEIKIDLCLEVTPKKNYFGWMRKNEFKFKEYDDVNGKKVGINEVIEDNPRYFKNLDPVMSFQESILSSTQSLQSPQLQPVDYSWKSVFEVEQKEKTINQQMMSSSEFSSEEINHDCKDSLHQSWVASKYAEEVEIHNKRTKIHLRAKEHKGNNSLIQNMICKCPKVKEIKKEAELTADKRSTFASRVSPPEDQNRTTAQEKEKGGFVKRVQRGSPTQSLRSSS